MPASLKDTAQAFADKLAVRVFPFKIDEDGKKKPLVTHWNRRASRDTSTFADDLWAQADGYGVMPAGYTVIDFDTPDALRTFASKLRGDAVDTMIVDTPRGLHMWFRGETAHKDGLFEHVDIRSGDEKGYIIGPGSVDPSRHAEWVAREGSWEVAQMPTKIRNLIMLALPDRADRPAQVERANGGTWDELLGAGRNHALNALKGTLLRKGVPESAANEMVRTANSLLPEPLSESEMKSTVLLPKPDWERGPLELSVPLTPNEVLGRWLTMDDIVRMPPPSYIIDPIFPEGTVNIMFGPPGSYKSFVALDWAARISAGLPLPGYNPVPRPDLVVPDFGTVRRRMKVLYVAAEGVGGLGSRVRASLVARDSGLLVERNGWNLTDIGQVSLLRQAMIENGIQLVIYDTLRKISAGADENSVQDMGGLMTNLERMAVDDNITTMLIHHSNKTEGGRNFRGSSALEGDAYNMWNVRKGGSMEAIVEATKFKDAEMLTVRAHLELNESAGSLFVSGYGSARTPDEAREAKAADVTEKHLAVEARVLKLIRERDGNINREEIASVLDLNLKGTVDRTLGRLKDEDVLRRDGTARTGRYLLRPPLGWPHQ